ncbi:hypothetical protein [Embleya sp. NPDC005575]|uniref:hypothetical protein n=1 Tax=Embleya sp. NPDC005575 TaxID=3156892 RepID=UPI00339F2224
MSEKRRPPHRETIQALVGVAVIVIGLLTTLILHLTHDPDPTPPPRTPIPITSTAPATSPTAPPAAAAR